MPTHRHWCRHNARRSRLIHSEILYLINYWPDVMTFSADVHVPQRMNPNDFQNPDLSQVKMSTLHTGWIAIINALDVHGPQRMKTVYFYHMAFTIAHLRYKISFNLIDRLL